MEGRCGIRTDRGSVPVANAVKCAEVNSTVTSPSSHRPRSSRVTGRETRKRCPTARRPRGFHGTSRTSVPGRSSGRARREGVRLRGSPTPSSTQLQSPSAVRAGDDHPRDGGAQGVVTAPSLCQLSERTHSPAHTEEGRTGKPLASAPSRTDQNLRDLQPRSDKPRETSLRGLPEAPPPASGWPLIGGRGGAGPLSSAALTVWPCRSLAHSRVFSEGLPARTEGGEGRLSGWALPVQSRFVPAAASTLGILSGRPDHSS